MRGLILVSRHHLFGCFHELGEVGEVSFIFSVAEAANGIEARDYGVDELIGMSDGGVCDTFVLELDGVTQLLAFGVLDVAVVRAVVLGRCIEVPAVDRVVCPAASGVGLFVDLDVAAHRGQRHLVVVKWVVEVCIRGQFGISIGLSQEVQSDLCLWEETISEL